MVRQALRQLKGAGAGRLDAHGQGAHAPLQQPRLERSQHAADARQIGADAGPQLVLRLGHQRAGDDVGMTVEIFGRRMHDDVGAQGQRLGEDRRGDGGIHRQPGAHTPGQLGDGGDVGDAPYRIGGGFQPDQLGLAGLQRGLHRRDTLGLHQLDLEAPAGGGVAQPAAQGPIHHLRRDDMIAWGECQEHRRGRGHAGREEQRFLAPLESRQQIGRHLVSGVVGARIDPAMAILIIGIAQIRGRGMDRRHDHAVDRICTEQALCRQGFRRPFLAVFAIHRRS